MTDKVEIELFVAINEDGDWVVTKDDGEALTLLGDEFASSQGKVVKIKLHIAPPVMEEIEVNVPDTAGTTSELEVS